MANPREKYKGTVDEAVAQLISRADDARALTAADITPRITAALEKYLFVSDASPERSEIKQFIGDIRADDLCLILACERGDEKAWEDLVANFDSTVKSAARKI